ncbi:kinase-like protein, partial [Melanomma pulvis-pyrius CBS 109.77]
LAQTICESAPRLFATLGYIKKEREIAHLLDEEISDKDLPFEIQKSTTPENKYALQGKGGKKIKCIAQWTDKVSEKFHRHQWWMNAPVFKEGVHHDLDNNDMLPIINRTAATIAGGFSKVYLAEIHSSHHNFSGVKQSDEGKFNVAIKKLTTNNSEEDFKRETEFFKTLVSKQHGPHPHLINLLATYRWKGKYHLILPCATENLETYWRNTKPDYSEETMRWCLNQMAGIVNGLLDIHECTIPNTTEIGRGSSSSIKLKRGEEKFGRHGDIKAENILWFASSAASDDPKGTLKIADFGLGRFHGRDTRSNVDWRQIKSSPTYEPPELKLHKPVSRAYDMWSLGCIFLEFATWMLKGQEGNEDFADERGSPDSNPIFKELSNDEFFTVIDTDRTMAVVRDGVVRWVAHLHQHKNCSAFIHDLLDMIMGHLLVIRPAYRYGAVELDRKFQSFRQKAKAPEYLV